MSVPDASTPPAAAVEVEGLCVRLGSRAVLEGVNLRIERGQLVALIGPNGAGKTTLLRSLLGLQPLAGGCVRLFGQTELGAVLGRVGYVPQRVALGPGLLVSVREFLCLRRRETRHWLWRRHARTDALLGELGSITGIEGLLDRPLGGLSGGQLQRVLITFSLLGRPELLLLDEPTAGVDTPGEETFYETIAGIHRRQGITVVLVSHDLSMVYRHATRIVALNRTICCQGTPEQVMNAESLKAAHGIHVTPYHHVH